MENLFYYLPIGILFWVTFKFTKNKTRVLELNISSQKLKVLELSGWANRIVGLINHVQPEGDTAFHFPKAKKVHTMGMQFPISIAFLNKEKKVLKIYHDVPPGKKSIVGPKGTDSVLEMTGRNDFLHEGMILSIKESGAIIFLFCAFLLLFTGFISASLVTGQLVNEKIKTQNTADYSAMAMGAHAATGLNMIAMNNLSIGASIHVASSVSILAMYGSLVKMLNYSIVESVNIFNSPIQSDVYNSLASIPAIYFQMAAGLTRENDVLAKNWLYPTAIRGAEISRLNTPGSLMIPVTRENPLLPFVASYEGFKRTTPYHTICHTLLSSQKAVKQDGVTFLNWLRGPLLAIADQNSSNALNNVIGVAEKLIGAVMKVMPIEFIFTNCGTGTKGNLADVMDALGKGLDISNDIVSMVIIEKEKKILRDAFSVVSDYADDAMGDLSFPERIACEGVDLLIGGTPSEFNLKKELTLRTAMLRLKGGESAKALLTAKYLRELQNTKGPCVKLEINGKKECIERKDINWVCPLFGYRGNIDKDSVMFWTMPTLSCGKVKDRWNHFPEANCHNYTKMAALASGWTIYDIGEMAKNYTGNNDDRKSSLGFIYIDPEKEREFEQSVDFISIVGSPKYSQVEVHPKECPEGFESYEKTNSETPQKKCDVTPLIYFGEQYKNQDSLWTRTFWAVGESNVIYEPTHDDPTPSEVNMKMFWPAWHEQPKNFDAIDELLKMINKKI